MALSGEAVALYWDFENLHASLVDQANGQGAYVASRYRPQDDVVDIAAIIEFALSLGPIAINRAFANWLSFNRYKQALLQSAIELIQIFPPGANAKNGADIKLCLDVMEDMVRFPHISTIIVVGGDSDYMPLSYKVKAAGRTLVGIGSRRTTNQHWARSCHEFKYYEALLSTGAAQVAPVAPVQEPNPTPLVVEKPALAAADVFAVAPATFRSPPDASENNVPTPNQTGDSVQALNAVEGIRPPDARELLTKALARLAQTKGEVWVNKAGLRPYLQRMDSTFHESNYGYATFNELIASMSDLIEVRRGEFDHEVRLRA
jgi:uncharacterized LabA/DUF88 family protein